MPRDLKALSNQLANADAVKRSEAIEQIGLMGEDAAPLAVPLVRSLADSDETVRALATSALEGLGPPAQESVDELEQMLTDANADIAFWAATLLGRLEGGAISAVEALKTASAEHPSHEVRKRATWALGKIASG